MYIYLYFLKYNIFYYMLFTQFMFLLYTKSVIHKIDYGIISNQDKSFSDLNVYKTSKFEN